MQWGKLSDTSPQWGMGENRRISDIWAVVDVQSAMSPLGDGGGDEDVWHIHNGGCSVRYVPTAGLGAEVDFSHVCRWGCSLTNVPSGGWWRRGGSLACMQWGMLTDKCPYWGIGEDRRICAMYTVGDVQ